MKVQPCIFRQCAIEAKKSVDVFCARPYVIRHRDAKVVHSYSLCGFFFCHVLRDAAHHAAFGEFVLAKRGDVCHMPTGSFQAAALVGTGFALTLADICPVALSVPAHGDAVQKTMRLLPQIDIVQWACRPPAQVFRDVFQLFGCKGSAARDMKCCHPLARGHIARIEVKARVRRPKGIFRRAEIARQLRFSRAVQPPDKSLVIPSIYRRFCLLHL